MNFGQFDQKNKEYSITTPLTPVRWINYIGGLDFGGFIDQTGAVLLCKGDPAENRITKYIPQLPGGDMNGTAFYVREKTAQGYKVYSPFYSPCRDEGEDFNCRVGLGYNRISSSVNGIELEGTFFIPQNHQTLIMDMRIRNKSSQSKEVDFIPVVEYTHFDALKQFTNTDWVPQTMASQKKEKDGKTALIQYAFMMRDIKWNYLVSNGEASSFETDRSKFLGKLGNGSWAAPGALEEKDLSNYEALRGDNIAALMHQLGSLAPGEEKRIILQLGQTEKIGDEIWDHISPYLDAQKTDQAFADLEAYWEDYLSAIQVKTPSQAMDDMLNVHHPKQCLITRNWSRYLSSYQLGLGARGMGFRDSSQDLLGAMQNDPQGCLKLLKTIISMQKPDGSAMHQFNPLSLIANEGDSRESEDRPDYYGDDHLWMVLATAFYLKETGDFDFLNQEINFYKPEGTEKGTVWEHIIRALRFTSTNTGANGLPLLGFADWNDTVNLPTGAESTFNASLYGWGLKEAQEIAKIRGEESTAQELAGLWDVMNKNVNDNAWDGEWFIRYFDEKQNPIGSHKNEKGKIFVNGQSWPILAGYATGERAETALASVNKHLNTEHGIKVSWPGYDGYDPHIGGITTYPSGAKENGGIFLHTNPWVIIAETKMGHGDRAFEYYTQINPAAKDSSLYECEPYCYAQNILADEHPQFGLARNSWLSGTSSWTFVASTQFILGVRPGYQGLEIDPVVPKDWDVFSVKRKYRGATYEVVVTNPSGVNRGLKTLKVNGKEVQGNLVPLAKAGEIVKVEAVLG
ncbi:MAG: glycosyl transferase [Spirochaetaceae bacterium]|nr:glycosyl transferase [Spirochaetaceae bacterium]